ncbi:MAG TPA: enoyl-CoA hydratase/isomerase family protein [Acidimicrobiia bacterium]|nr:enoyl-CoA hydratase/isomerase family protein [Acidimicrobiia bacterium]
MDAVQTWAAKGLEYSVADDGVAWLRLNRPEKRNAIDRPLRTSIIEAVKEATEDPAVRCAVITANGTAFSAGADLTQEGGAIEIPPERRRASNLSRDEGMLYGWYRMFEAIWRSHTPFIAGVNGIAAGGGCQLALGCDLIIASEAASFWEIFVRRGLPLEGGGAWLLTRSLSLPRAKEIALYGEPLPAKKAEEWGLVNRCVPAEEFESTLADWAHRLANLEPVRTGPPMGAPPADGVPRPAPDLSARVSHIKGQLNAAWEETMQQTFIDEVTLMGIHGGFASPAPPTAASGDTGD